MACSLDRVLMVSFCLCSKPLLLPAYATLLWLVVGIAVGASVFFLCRNKEVQDEFFISVLVLLILMSLGGALFLTVYIGPC